MSNTETIRPIGSEYKGFQDHVGRATGTPHPEEFHAPPLLIQKQHPVYHGFLTQYYSKLSTLQTGRCADFDMRHQECLEAYGNHPDTRPCQLYRDDLYECMNHNKQKARWLAMREERDRQFKAGLREKRFDLPEGSLKERYDV